MKEKKYIKLIKEAKTAAKHSRSKYSKFSVGSAVLCSNGKIYRGANIENASYGLTNCAERSALFNAVSAGEKNIEIIAVWTKSGNAFPCGACRQVILELAPNADVAVNRNNKDIAVINIKDLLPYSFSEKNLGKSN